MLDSFNRQINYLRISITDRCNLRCRYCMPEDGVKLLHHKDILTFEEIVEVVKYGAMHGITKVRITGGEPLVRKGVVKVVAMISAVSGIKDIAMTTNGILLSEQAKALKDAGLQRVNISLDTTDPIKYKHITRGGDITQVFHGIKEARRVGLYPIKINCVIEDSITEHEALEVAKWGAENKVDVRFIKSMKLYNGTFSRVIGGDGGECKICNRLRLTADGYLKPCLFNNMGFSIRNLGIEKAFQEAIVHKPARGSQNTKNMFYNIGG